MNDLNFLPKTCVQIYQSDVYHGSGVLVEIGSSFYVLSAAHVFSQDIREPIEIKKFHCISEKYGRIYFDDLIGTQESYSKYDIIAISVEKSHEFIDFPIVKFCDDISFPDLSLVFRGTQKSIARKPHSIKPCSVDTLPDDEGVFCLKVPLDAYSDMQGNVGADVLGGYSGSGIYILGADDIYLVGIAQNIDKDDFTGVNCRSVKIVQELFLPNIEFSDFHGGNKQLRINIAEIRRSITQELIDKRKSSDYGDVENITRKMNSFIENWTTEDLDGFIHDILIWESIEHNKIRNNSFYRDIIENTKAIWASGNKKYQVSSIQHGNERFHKILDELTELLKIELDGTAIKSSSPVIAAGEVARLLANCTLDFKK